MTFLHVRFDSARRMRQIGHAVLLKGARVRDIYQIITPCVRCACESRWLLATQFRLSARWSATCSSRGYNYRLNNAEAAQLLPLNHPRTRTVETKREHSHRPVHLYTKIARLQRECNTLMMISLRIKTWRGRRSNGPKFIILRLLQFWYWFWDMSNNRTTAWIHLHIFYMLESEQKWLRFLAWFFSNVF